MFVLPCCTCAFSVTVSVSDMSNNIVNRLLQNILAICGQKADWFCGHFRSPPFWKCSPCCIEMFSVNHELHSCDVFCQIVYVPCRKPEQCSMLPANRNVSVWLWIRLFRHVRHVQCDNDSPILEVQLISLLWIPCEFASWSANFTVKFVAKMTTLQWNLPQIRWE